jgi:hypothetical protein
MSMASLPIACWATWRPLRAAAATAASSRSWSQNLTPVCRRPSGPRTHWLLAAARSDARPVPPTAVLSIRALAAANSVIEKQMAQRSAPSMNSLAGPIGVRAGPLPVAAASVRGSIMLAADTGIRWTITGSLPASAARS